MLTTTNLTKRFGTRTLWHDLNLEVHDGEMIAITGPSGCGKSTLLNCIGLLEPINGGTITLDNTNLTRLRPGQARRLRRDQLGYLFQNYALIENLSALGNLRESVGARPRRSRASRTDCEQALTHVGLADHIHDRVYQLSGGEQQRVALARLIVRHPTLVLADEPTGALDHTNTEMVIATLRTLAHDGATILIATHSDHVVSGCDREISLAPDHAAETPPEHPRRALDDA